MIDCEALLKKVSGEQHVACNILLVHSRNVARKAIAIASRYKGKEIDTGFLYEAALLHDIGTLLTYAPGIACNGAYPYISHGILGRQILEEEGLPKHALVCERHIGVGLTLEDICTQKLPLPKRAMIPLSVEEQIICFADNFFSKHPEALDEENSLHDIRAGFEKFGISKVKQFDQWIHQFGI